MKDNLKIQLRMTDGYGIATNYLCKNECPKCKSRIVKNGAYRGCYDGEWTYVDSFTCENKCRIYYTEMREYNDVKSHNENRGL